jgi:hypothetical protein
MKQKLLKKYREKQFLVAYRILRNIGERHTAAGHNVHFKAVNEAYVRLECVNCPNFRLPASVDKGEKDAGEVG